jgi:hemerythrin-like domain-containing protein
MPIQIGQQEAGYDDPVGLMTACHRRIEQFLRTLCAAAERAEGRELEREEAEAIQRSLRYFREAAPHHTEDEESDLFPALVDRAPEVREAIERLESDHEEAGILHARLDELGEQWVSQKRLTANALTEFRACARRLEKLYRAHIDVEERDVFPLAAQVLKAEELDVIGRQMAARRGAAFVTKPSRSALG